MDPSGKLKSLALRRELLMAQSDVLRLTLVQQSTRLAPVVIWGERCQVIVKQAKSMLPAAGPMALLLLLKNFKSLRKAFARGAVLLSLYRKGREMAESLVVKR